MARFTVGTAAGVLPNGLDVGAKPHPARGVSLASSGCACVAARHCGGDGADSLYGGTGADIILGGVGADYIEGSLGIDQLFGDE